MSARRPHRLLPMKPTLQRLVALIFLIPLLVWAEPPRITFSGGDGSTFGKAVVIHGATEESGVHAEYEYIEKHHPGYHRGEQALRGHQQHMYDVLNFTTADGKKMTIYFDITEFFGK